MKIKFIGIKNMGLKKTVKNFSSSFFDKSLVARIMKLVIVNIVIRSHRNHANLKCAVYDLIKS